ncbi:lipase 3 [Anabrus simplex]|uniref:lipase 3 n=1 Tax=Anabrus simplex TaxID=316456 RepID=UPI0035A331F3
MAASKTLLFLGFVAICLLTGGLATEIEVRNLDPDIHLTTPQLVAKYGYPIEEHEVTTADGYILTLHRIPYGKKSPASENRPPVLLQHGLLCSSADWVVMGPEHGFGYLLADAGYDVWLGNARGNVYSKKHRDDITQGEYWDFSWHEMGIYDLPAVIDHILETTKQEKLFYAGHSMGTTMFYVMASERPEYNDKIRAMFSMAPVAHMNHMQNIFVKLIANFTDGLGVLLNLLGVNEFMPKTELLESLGQLLCRDTAITQDICSNILFLIAGFDSDQLNKTALPVILGHTPAGAATKEFLHYGQTTHSKKFRKYDYGLLGNMKRYGSIHPPEYKLNKITAPVALHYGVNDLLADEQDTDTLSHELPNTIGKFRVAHDKFNHLDFLWAIDAKPLLYDIIIRFMGRY